MENEMIIRNFCAIKCFLVIWKVSSCCSERAVKRHVGQFFCVAVDFEWNIDHWIQNTSNHWRQVCTAHRWPRVVLPMSLQFSNNCQQFELIPSVVTVHSWHFLPRKSDKIDNADAMYEMRQQSLHQILHITIWPKISWFHTNYDRVIEWSLPLLLKCIESIQSTPRFSPWPIVPLVTGRAVWVELVWSSHR